MRKKINLTPFLIILLVLQAASLPAQKNPGDSSSKTQAVSITQPDTGKIKKDQNINKDRNNPSGTTADTCACKTPAIKCRISDGKLGWERWILVYLPVFLFFIVVGFFLSLILRGKFDLTETLSTGQSAGFTRTTSADGAVTETPKSVGSTSRVIAFLTGVTALLVAICLLTYYAYFTVAECSGNLQFGDLWKILAGLGIGIIPYGVNVWRGNEKEKDSTGTK